MKTLLHLAVSPVDTQSRKLIEKELDRAADWIRYLPGNWLIYTGQPATVWYQRLSKVLNLEDTLMFVCEVDLTNRAGWIKTSAWDWIRKHREIGIDEIEPIV